jgi:hypothetical protein
MAGKVVSNLAVTRDGLISLSEPFHKCTHVSAAPQLRTSGAGGRSAGHLLNSPVAPPSPHRRSTAKFSEERRWGNGEHPAWRRWGMRWSPGVARWESSEHAAPKSRVKTLSLSILCLFQALPGVVPPRAWEHYRKELRDPQPRTVLRCARLLLERVRIAWDREKPLWKRFSKTPQGCRF